MRTAFHLLLLLLLLAAFAGVATADGEDPCAGETGAGLGLCTAYCEGAECDCDYDADCVVPNASPTGCFNIYFSYGFTTGNPLTCGDVCPCLDANGWPSNFAADIWNDLASGEQPANSCFDDGTTITLQFQPQFPNIGPIERATVTGSSCTMFFSQPVVSEAFEFTLTAEEAALCRARLEAQVLARQLTCQ